MKSTINKLLIALAEIDLIIFYYISELHAKKDEANIADARLCNVI